jgi:hypothetical protein
MIGNMSMFCLICFQIGVILSYSSRYQHVMSFVDLIIRRGSIFLLQLIAIVSMFCLVL